ncbi:MAG: hypothetical protein Sylvanvirus32_7 [Sylvanvirus sp.]|uniref:Uncharacterized protein n=1 Tax=Sylvanvirus sp. TaxID=2487774 RepID=A0A3G5ALH8_9VIRU|nr:MAG: hypothetical protein Sylvanvirus32_7 [Sylvanvirus sp.]
MHIKEETYYKNVKIHVSNFSTHAMILILVHYLSYRKLHILFLFKQINNNCESMTLFLENIEQPTLTSFRVGLESRWRKWRLKRELKLKLYPVDIHSEDLHIHEQKPHVYDFVPYRRSWYSICSFMNVKQLVAFALCNSSCLRFIKRYSCFSNQNLSFTSTLTRSHIHLGQDIGSSVLGKNLYFQLFHVSFKFEKDMYESNLLRPTDFIWSTAHLAQSFHCLRSLSMNFSMDIAFFVSKLPRQGQELEHLSIDYVPPLPRGAFTSLYYDELILIFCRTPNLLSFQVCVNPLQNTHPVKQFDMWNLHRLCPKLTSLSFISLLCDNFSPVHHINPIISCRNVLQASSVPVPFIHLKLKYISLCFDTGTCIDGHNAMTGHLCSIKSLYVVGGDVYCRRRSYDYENMILFQESAIKFFSRFQELEELQIGPKFESIEFLKGLTPCHKLRLLDLRSFPFNACAVPKQDYDASSFHSHIVDFLNLMPQLQSFYTNKYWKKYFFLTCFNNLYFTPHVPQQQIVSSRHIYERESYFLLYAK